MGLEEQRSLRLREKPNWHGPRAGWTQETGSEEADTTLWNWRERTEARPQALWADFRQLGRLWGQGQRALKPTCWYALPAQFTVQKLAPLPSYMAFVWSHLSDTAGRKLENFLHPLSQHCRKWPN